ncbi:MAG: LL-diaminopimelate aminotransferase [Actinobacteria bacterium]|nr:LL-diaminopimelate aminotransferase [Actinomycetota bacterium]MBU1942883.1 LL-diaminopimelate aminotransferase [Actinomycetota bacterium]MBU2687615.1 LL-diaminopimelate aminotransferase [Actinomycetota bacterium]
MRHSHRLEEVPPYLFAEIDRKIAERRAHGVDVISFGVGDPDLPTPERVVEVLAAESRKPENQGYPSYYGLPEFRVAASRFMLNRFGVSVDPEKEVLSLMGSKEGIAHMALAVLDPGDIALVPEPGYPVYAMGTILAGARSHFLPLERRHGFLPDLDSVPTDVICEAKILWLNYPNNPTGAVADLEFFAHAVDFARESDLVLAHDNAYSEITYDGFRAPSLLQVPGAMEVGIEFHSLSKTFNMTGWRVGFACGNASVIEALGTIKTNIDSGIFNPIQLAGVQALDGERETSQSMCETYRARRDFLVSELSGLGWDVPTPRGGIYIWMPVPPGYDSIGFSRFVLDRAGVFFTPGNAYGPSGEGYVRISLTVPDARIREAVARLKEAF